VPRTRWAPSPRAQRLACHRHERSISAFTRVFDALSERVGVRGAFVGYGLARCTPSPRRRSASKTRVNALMAATLSRKGRGYDPAARVELIEPSCHRHELGACGTTERILSRTILRTKR
jgi:hypothetical protein